MEEGSCVICLSPPSEVAKINCCDHVFCFDCILQWSKVENTCPLCKSRFESISRVDAEAPEAGSRKRKRGTGGARGGVARTVKVAKRSQTPPDQPRLSLAAVLREVSAAQFLGVPLGDSRSGRNPRFLLRTMIFGPRAGSAMFRLAAAVRAPSSSGSARSSPPNQRCAEEGGSAANPVVVEDDEVEVEDDEVEVLPAPPTSSSASASSPPSELPQRGALSLAPHEMFLGKEKQDSARVQRRRRRRQRKQQEVVEEPWHTRPLLHAPSPAARPVLLPERPLLRDSEDMDQIQAWDSSAGGAKHGVRSCVAVRGDTIEHMPGDLGGALSLPSECSPNPRPDAVHRLESVPNGSGTDPHGHLASDHLWVFQPRGHRGSD